jgi:hypothetical protein
MQKHIVAVPRQRSQNKQQFNSRSLWNASCCVCNLIKYYVPSNATQRMYNIQFILLKSQHVSTIFIWSSSGEYKYLMSALLNCNRFTSHMSPYLQWFLFDDSINMDKIYILNEVVWIRHTV